MSLQTIAYFVTKEEWVLTKLLDLCQEFNIHGTCGHYFGDFWMISYDELQVSFLEFYVVKLGWPCKV